MNRINHIYSPEISSIPRHQLIAPCIAQINHSSLYQNWLPELYSFTWIIDFQLGSTEKRQVYEVHFQVDIDELATETLRMPLIS